MVLNDRRIRVIEDFPDSSIVFPGTHVKSGVCFFLWNRDNPGDAEITTRRTDGTESTSLRPLREKDSDVFLRYNESISILRKVINFENGPAGKTNSLLLDPENQFSALVKLSNPFGFRSFFRGRPSLTSKTDRVIYQNRGFGYVSDKEITENRELVDTWKIFIGKAYGGDEKYPHSILSRPFIGAPGSICTERSIQFRTRREERTLVYFHQAFPILGLDEKTYPKHKPHYLLVCPSSRLH